MMSENVELILTKIKEVESVLSPSDYTEETHVDYYNKATAVLTALEQRIKTQKSLLYNTPVCNGILNNINNLSSYVDSWHRTQNPTYINHINNTLNELIEFLSKIPTSQKGDTSSALDKILKSFENSNIDIIKKLNAEKDTLQQQVAQLTKNIEILEKRVDDKSNQLDNITNNQQQQFSAAQEKRLNDFANKLDEFTGQFEAQKTEQDNLYSENFQTLTENAKKRLADMQQIQQKIEKIYEIVGKESVVGSQNFYANEAASKSRTYFWISFVVMSIVALGALTVFIIALCNHTTMTFEWLVSRLSFFGVFLLPSISMANESKKQRDKENVYRELEVKMACIEPYFNNISDKPKDSNTDLPEKDCVKLELAKNLLSPGKVKTEDNVIIPKDVLEFIKDLVHVNVGKK